MRTTRTGGGRKNGRRRIRHGAIALLLLVALAGAGCGDKKTPEPAVKAAAPRVEDMSRDPVTVHVTFEPESVRLDRDLLMIVRVSAPAGVDVTLPSLDDRGEGFLVAGTFERGPFTEHGVITTERHVRLTPTLADVHRIAPFPITYRDHRVEPARDGWFPTRPIRLDVVPPVEGGAGKDITVRIEPVWVRPPFRSVAIGVAAGLAGLALLALLWRLSKRVRRHLRLMRLSPRERALEELAELLAGNLIERDLIKEFYLRLTMIVRRYIERAHAIRAPEQTTEEFLKAVGEDPRFAPDVLRRLKHFLQAADLVKFAADRPDREAIDAATRTARDYIETDSEDPAQRIEADAGTAGTTETKG